VCIHIFLQKVKTFFAVSDIVLGVSFGALKIVLKSTHTDKRRTMLIIHQINFPDVALNRGIFHSFLNRL